MRGNMTAILAMVMLVTGVEAEAGGGRRHHVHHHHRGHVGVFIGVPLLLAPLWARPYYAPPVVVRERVIVREPLVFYDEHGNPAPQHPSQAAATEPSWFFCPDSQTYYPYVQTCATQWQREAPQPPPNR